MSSNKSFGAVKTRRFLSRVMAGVNEVKVNRATPLDDLDEELRQEFGQSISKNAALAGTIKDKAEEAELLRYHYKNIYKAYAASTTALLAYVESIKAIDKALGELIDDLADGNDTAVLKASMIDLRQLNGDTEANLAAFAESTERILIKPLQQFVKRDVRDARYFSHEVLKVQVEYESSIRTLNQIKSKTKADPRKYSAALGDFRILSTKFEQVAEQARTKHALLQSVNCLDNAQRAIDYMRAVRGCHTTAMQHFDQLTPRLDENEQRIRARMIQRDDTVNQQAREIIGEETRRMDAQYDSFLQLLTRPPLKALAALCDTVSPDDADTSIEALVRVTQQRGMLVPALTQLVRAETKPRSAEWDPRPLFVDQPTAAKLLASFLKQNGRHYAASVAGAVVRAVALDEHALEIDTSRVDADTAAANGERLAQLMGDVVGAVVASVDLCPAPLRQLAAQVWRHGRDAAEAQQAADYDPAQDVVGLVFARFFVPALASPDAFGIVTEDALAPGGRRTLQLLSQLLRNIVTWHGPGPEPYWDAVPSGVYAHFTALRDYAAALGASVAAPSQRQSAVGVLVSDQAYDALVRQHDLDPLVQRVQRHLASINAALVSDGGHETATALTSIVQGFTSS